MEAHQKLLEEVKVERENLIKKAGKKGPQVEQELGVLDEREFSHLSEAVLEALLTERLNGQDAVAGCIFDNLTSEHYAHELIGLKLIMKVLKEQRV